jgi:hypothetical protein
MDFGTMNVGEEVGVVNVINHDDVALARQSRIRASQVASKVKRKIVGRMDRPSIPHDEAMELVSAVEALYYHLGWIIAMIDPKDED